MTKNELRYVSDIPQSQNSKSRMGNIKCRNQFSTGLDQGFRNFPNNFIRALPSLEIKIRNLLIHQSPSFK